MNRDMGAGSNTSPRIVALVPMRHQSERVPQKNYRDFNGKPLFFWIVETLLAIPLIQKVAIDTDSSRIKELAVHFGEGVLIIDRPEHLRSGHTPMNGILLHDIAQIDADYYLQTHSTNPLLKKETIERAIETFLGSRDRHDSLFGVTRLQTRLYDKDGRAMNHNPDKLERTQDLPPVYEENSNLYIFTKNILQTRKNRIGFHPMMFEIPRHEAWDIDEEIDFRVAELLARDTKPL